MPYVVLDKLSKVTCGANELLYTGDGLWVAHFGDLLNTFLTRQHSFGGNFMSKIRQALFEEVAFRRLELQPVQGESIQNCLQPFEVVFGHARVHDHVIKVDEGVLQVQLAQAVLHQALESRRHIAQPVGHPEKLVDPKTANRERHILT